jgi:ankyrin repeat protein
MSLQLAARDGNATLLKRFLADGVEIDEKVTSLEDKAYGWTALHFAVNAGHIEIVRSLLSSGANPQIQEDKDDRTPLLMAAAKGDIESVKLLLEYKALVDVQQLDGDTPLICAASEGYPSIVKLLLLSGADAHIKDNLGWTALIWAATNGNEAVVELLIDDQLSSNESESEEDRTALLISASIGNTEIAKLLLRNKYDPKLPSYQKAMMAAATNGHFEIVELLRKFAS